MSSVWISSGISVLKATLEVPGDKSITHRAIMLSSLANGVSTVSGALLSRDCEATISAFQAMGVRFEFGINNSLKIHGVGKFGLKKPYQSIDCGNSGTSMRLLTGILAAQNFSSQLIGDESLSCRPMERISQPLSQMGAKVSLSQKKFPPITISKACGLDGICYHMPVASAQVKSALLFAAMYASSPTEIIESAVTRNHTELMLLSLSYPVDVSDNKISLSGNGCCQPATIKVPGDLSSAAFFIVAATVLPGSELVIRGVGVNPTRMGLITILGLMGAKIELRNTRNYGLEPVADIHVSSSELHGIDIPVDLVSLAIDEFPVIMIAAAFAVGVTTICGAMELRIKESDRLLAMVNGLQRLGIRAELLEDGACIFGGSIVSGTVDSYKDHRVAMAFLVAGALARQSIVVHDCDPIVTSFPQFLSMANQIGFNIREQ